MEITTTNKGESDVMGANIRKTGADEDECDAGWCKKPKRAAKL